MVILLADLSLLHCGYPEESSLKASCSVRISRLQIVSNSSRTLRTLHYITFLSAAQHRAVVAWSYHTQGFVRATASMAADGASKRRCIGVDCENDAGSLQCPTCLKIGKESYFCSQDCFKRSWVGNAFTRCSCTRCTYTQMTDFSIGRT